MRIDFCWYGGNAEIIRVSVSCASSVCSVERPDGRFQPRPVRFRSFRDHAFRRRGSHPDPGEGCRAGLGKRAGIDIDFALGDKRFFVLVKEFDRVFDRDDVAVSLARLYDRRSPASVVDFPEPVVPVTRIKPRFSSAMLFRTGGRPSSRKVSDLVGDYAGDDADRISLLKNIDAETSESGNAVADIDLVDLFEMLLLAIRHHRERHFERFFLVQFRRSGQRHEFAVDADNRSRAGTQMQVAGAEAHRHAQKIVDSGKHIRKAMDGEGSFERLVNEAGEGRCQTVKTSLALRRADRQ